MLLNTVFHKHKWYMKSPFLPELFHKYQFYITMLCCFHFFYSPALHLQAEYCVLYFTLTQKCQFLKDFFGSKIFNSIHHIHSTQHYVSSEKLTLYASFKHSSHAI